MSVRVVSVVATVGLFSSAAAFAAPVIAVGGACPGVVDITMTGGTANGSSALVTGTAGGTTMLANGACAGTVVNVGGAKLRSIKNANAAGERDLHPTLAAGACATSAQWIDLTNCALSAVTSLTPACTIPANDVADVGPVAGPPYMADPSFAAVWTEASVAAGLREDWEYEDVVANIPASSIFVADFYDAAFTLLCSTVFDISGATVDPAYTASSIDPLTGLPNLVLPVSGGVNVDLAGGFSDCGPVDPAVWGTEDLRDIVIGNWGFGYNAISADLRGEIVLAVTQAVYNTDYAPFVIGESIDGSEINFAATYERTCEVVDVDPVTGFLTLLNKPAGALPVVKEHGAGFPWYVYVL